MTEREAFEAWFIEDFRSQDGPKINWSDEMIKDLALSRDSRGEYCSKYASFAWKAWRDSRAQLMLEPFGYWHEGHTWKECEFFLAAESDNGPCDRCIPLYRKAPARTFKK